MFDIFYHPNLSEFRDAGQKLIQLKLIQLSSAYLLN